MSRNRRPRKSRRQIYHPLAVDRLLRSMRVAVSPSASAKRARTPGPAPRNRAWGRARGEKDRIAREYVCALATERLKRSTITRQRAKVRSYLTSKVGNLTTRDLYRDGKFDKIMESLLRAYDRYFFGGALGKMLTGASCGVAPQRDRSGSRKRKGRAGITILKNRTTRLHLNRRAFKDAVTKLEDGRIDSLDNGGLECTDVMSCLMLTFEHELVHAITFCLASYRDLFSDRGCGNWRGKTARDLHSKTFMSILNNTFDHSTFQHSLFDSTASTRREARRERFPVGMRVYRVGESSRKLYGRVIRRGLVQMSDGSTLHLSSGVKLHAVPGSYKAGATKSRGASRRRAR